MPAFLSGGDSGAAPPPWGSGAVAGYGGGWGGGAILRILILCTLILLLLLLVVVVHTNLTRVFMQVYHFLWPLDYMKPYLVLIYLSLLFIYSNTYTEKMHENS